MCDNILYNIKMKNNFSKKETNKNNEIKIIYAGLNQETFFLLNKSFYIFGVAHIDDFNKFTLNPFGLIFKLIYYLRRRNLLRFFELFLIKIWCFTYYFSSSYFKKYSLFLKTISLEKIEIIDFSDKDFVKNLIEINEIDLLVVNTWEMLPDMIIYSPRLGTLNIHPSKLPKYKGALPELWALKNHDNESAVTYMLLDKTMDGGAILAQYHFDLSKEDNWFTILEKEKNVVGRTLVDDINSYVKGDLLPSPQYKALSSFTEKYELYRRIDWEKEEILDIYNKINFYPYDIPNTFCFTYLKGKKIYIKKAGICGNILGGSKEKRFCIQDFNLCVNCGGRVIIIKLFRDIDFLSSILIIFNKKNIKFK